MLALDGVWKSYRIKGVRKSLLEDVSVVFPPGRSVALMGRNGAGKSTLMRLIAGIEPPDRGRVIRDARTSWPLGFAGGFNGSMTGLENIRFVARLYGCAPREVQRFVEAFSELGESLRLPVRTYSSGMKARLAFGVSMAIPFETYLVDEITAVGDARFKRKSRAVLEDRLSGARVIMISHSLSTIRAHCDCGYLLRDRGLVFFDDIEELIAAYRAEAERV